MRPVFFFAWIAIPLLASIAFLSRKYFELQELQERFAVATRKERLAMERQQRKKRCIERYSKSSPYFLDQFIECFPLLQGEKKSLESFLQHPAFPPSPAVAERLAFLEKNRFSFREEAIEASEEMKEVHEQQQYPVQMDESDLKQILCLIEDFKIGENVPNVQSPQMLIKEFRLKKLQTPLQTEVFEVEMNLLKREFNSL